MRTGARRPKINKARPRRWARCVLGLAFCVLSPLLYGSDLQERPTQEQVKAVYLYNFGKFVRWQAMPEASSFDICVLGKNPFGAALNNTVAGERIAGKIIVVRELAGITETSHCQILFVSTSEEGRLKATLAAAKHANTLTVSDIPEFAAHGGMIGLVNIDGKIRFEVNLGAVNEAGLSVSSELLKVAVKVIGPEQAKETGR